MHANYRRWLATAMLLAGLISASCNNKASNVTSERATTLAELYSLRSVPTFDIKLSSEGIESLRENPKEWIVGDFEYAGKKYSSVSLRLKGHRSLPSIG